LMLASRLGNAQLVNTLCDIGADTEQVNNQGLNALQIALMQACLDKKFAMQSLPDIYTHLAPAEITLQVEGRLLKLLRHTMEYTLLNLMMAFFNSLVPETWRLRNELFNAPVISHICMSFPDSVLPPHRKKRQYISSMLAKNERSRDDRYNRKIFKRIKRGQYIINPNIAIRVQDEWVNIYDLLQLDRLTFMPSIASDEFGYGSAGYTKAMMQELIERIRLDTSDSK